AARLQPPLHRRHRAGAPRRNRSRSSRLRARARPPGAVVRLVPRRCASVASGGGLPRLPRLPRPRRALVRSMGEEPPPPPALPAPRPERPDAGACVVALEGRARVGARRVIVTLLPGDGIGPEVIGAAQRVLEATGVAPEWEVHEVGRRAAEPLPEAVLESI